MFPQDGRHLVSIESRTAQLLSQILSPLAPPRSIHCILQNCMTFLEVEMPKLRLSFNLGRGTTRMRSREFRGAVIDPDQSLGTLIGFRNKIMLKDELSGDRRVLLIQGHCSFSQSDTGGAHTTVTVDYDSPKGWHAFDVDTCLRRLVDNGSIQSKLFLAYLHALTSYCTPDPLIKRTGTEQAIDMLESSAVRSFDELTTENIDLLLRIANLSPKRTFYPANEKLMQRIDWCSALGFMAQYNRFHEIVDSILGDVKRSKIFYPNSQVDIPKLPGTDPLLLQRDIIRSATLRVSGYGAEGFTCIHDVSYQSRDRDQGSTKRRNSYALTYQIHTGSLMAPSAPPSAEVFWDFFRRSSRIQGPEYALDLSQVKYNSTLLDSNGTLLHAFWPALHKAIGEHRNQKLNKYALMIWLSTLSCSGQIPYSILELVGLIHTCQSLATITLPPILFFQVSEGFQVSSDEIINAMQACYRDYNESPEWLLPKLQHESNNQWNKRRSDQFDQSRRSALFKLATFFERQWPVEVPQGPPHHTYATEARYVNFETATSAVQKIFKTWFDNRALFQYLQSISATARGLGVRQIAVPQQELQEQQGNPGDNQSVAASDLFKKAAPCLDTSHQPVPPTSTASTQEKHARALETFVTQIERVQASSKYEQDYVRGLRESLQSLQTLQQQGQVEPLPEQALVAHLETCHSQVQKMYGSITTAVSRALCPDNPLSANARYRQWPRLCPMLFLQQLNKDNWPTLPEDWRRCFISYGMALNELQRAKRMMAAARSNRQTDVVAELQNPGHLNWKPSKYPETLLMEIESNIMIRSVQEDIAEQMRNPSGGNTSMQLNMGEGKSTVIVPMTAAALANCSQLVRVIVAKAQSKQMAQMLMGKLGGLLNRRVYYLPISRSLNFDEAAARTVDLICRECMVNGGILLLQPEHILSFQLMGLERSALGPESIARQLLRTQDFFSKYSRDIVDESDENFSVKFELIYSMGTQRSIDMSPHRWLCIQQVMDFVVSAAESSMAALPSSIGIHHTSPGVFPRIRILRSDAVESLVQSIGHKVCNAGLPGFPVTRQPETIRNAIFTYITQADLTSEEIRVVEKCALWNESTRPILFLLRGLLGGGVIGFVFSRKRWRVNFGLHHDRTPPTKLAVPFRAKDVATARSEFSHPDVVLLLTSICYYYGGLSDEQMFASFDHLLNSDQKDVEYQTWVKTAPGLPVSFRQLEGINLKDKPQCIDRIFPPLRFNKRVVDYYLANLVFPKEMKEFPQKLSASGWDIGKVKAHPTTAFSGTTDSKAFLPLDVKHLDLTKQHHTNALVLDYLLQPENSVILLEPEPESKLSEAERLLSTVINFDRPPRVILDVGAQILEMNNEEVAKAWLGMYSTEGVRAAVFVNDNDDLCVVDRGGVVELLLTSAFAKQLDACLVFLDEAHTRGIDLRLPSNYRAAVTLGASLTKDRLVQACMRMRKLGKGQSVVFCVPEEIRNKIQECPMNSCPTQIAVADVLRWCISETFTEVHRNMPLWTVQGQRFVHQEELRKNGQEDDCTNLSAAQAQALLEDEAQDLEARYRPKTGEDRFSLLSRLQSTTNPKLHQIVDRCRDFENLRFDNSALQEEQERELSPETQQERQQERPAPASPAAHQLHSHVLKFVSDGTVHADSVAYKSAFKALSDISAAANFDISQLRGSYDLLVTADFARTVKKTNPSDASDAYQRSVQWVLTSTARGSNWVQRAMIISPYEAHELYPELCIGSNVVLHEYKPCWNQAYRSLDKLDFFTTPALAEPRILPVSLQTQLNLFAGQLYFASYQEYLAACTFLGLASSKAENGWDVAADGFILKDGQGRIGGASKLNKSPVPFLKELARIRKNGEDFGKTHLGRMLDGELLTPADFESG